MATNDDKVIMVPVPRHDVTLTFDDILTPLTQTAKKLMQAAPTDESLSEALDPKIAQDLQLFTDLVTQLSDVVKRINQRAPNLLASKPGPPPASASIAILPPSSALTPGKRNTLYKGAFTAEGGKRPYRFQVVTPQAFPPGLTLAESGLLSGTPTKAGQFTFQIIARDATGETSTPQTYTLVIK